MLTSIDSPTLLLCSGKHCVKKRHEEHQALTDAICSADITFATIKCVGSCNGPTALVQTGDRSHFFENLRSPNTHNDLVDYVIRPHKPSKRLNKRELTGKRRKKAIKKLRN